MRPAISDSFTSGQPLYLLYSNCPDATHATGSGRCHVTGNAPTPNGPRGQYQGRGYYVSLVAEARGQRPLPDVKTVEDLKSEAYVRALSAQIETLVRETLHHDESDRFEIDVYLGKDPAQRHQALAEK